MSGVTQSWDGECVRAWLQHRRDAARLDQAAADRRGYAAQDDYDKAAAEEWVCAALQTGGHVDDHAAFAGHVKSLLGQEEYRTTGIYEDRRFDRNVRSHLRKIATMTKANDGFAQTWRYQR